MRKKYFSFSIIFFFFVHLIGGTGNTHSTNNEAMKYSVWLLNFRKEPAIITIPQRLIVLVQNHNFTFHRTHLIWSRRGAKRTIRTLLQSWNYLCLHRYFSPNQNFHFGNEQTNNNKNKLDDENFFNNFVGLFLVVCFSLVFELAVFIAYMSFRINNRHTNSHTLTHKATPPTTNTITTENQLLFVSLLGTRFAHTKQTAAAWYVNTKCVRSLCENCSRCRLLPNCLTRWPHRSAYRICLI